MNIKTALKVINWIKGKDESYIKREFPSLMEGMGSKNQLVEMAGLNVFIYTHFYYVMRINMHKVLEANKRLLVKGEDYTLVILNYYWVFNREYNYEYKEEMEEALDFIHTNLKENLTLELVANHVHISKNYLCKQFKNYTGEKFCNYVNHQRVEKAKSLLLHTDKPMDLVAADVGYNSQTHFSTTFKKWTGKTPMAYRKQKRRGLGS